jgi:hypothetical protein
MAADWRTTGTRVYTRDGRLAGSMTGSTHHCTMAGCTGLRISVRWPDGTHTFPCSKGLVPYKDGWRID